MKICFILFACLMLHAASLTAQRKFVERSTDVLCLAPSATGLIKAIVEKDKKGILQLGLSSATTLAINYGLEAVIKKDRPDGTGHHAFPSTHTAVAFDGASAVTAGSGACLLMPWPLTWRGGALTPNATTGGTCSAVQPSARAQRSSTPAPS